MAGVEVAVPGAGGTMGLGMAGNIARAGLPVSVWNRTRATMWVGGAGAGSRLKLVTNAWIVSVVEGGAETLALAEGLGLDPALFLEAIENGPLDMPYLRVKGRTMIERDFDPTFSLALATKDARLVEQSAQERGLDLPVLEAISRRMQQAVPEHGEEDLSATFLTSVPAEDSLA